MAEEERKLVVLSDADLEDVCWRAQRDDWADAILAAWRLIEPAFDDMDTVCPWHYAVPEGQWLAVAEALKRGPGGMSAALAWMSKGPSAQYGAPVQPPLEPPTRPLLDVEPREDLL
jgi:hypothetical protein